MTDDTEGPKPWDIEQYRGVRRQIHRKEDWEAEAELVLDASYRAERTSGKVTPRFDKDGPSLFWLALKTSVLTVLTLGLFRFWMVTMLRRHYWHSIRIQGDPLEYTGTGLEKILGFLVAIIILAIYLGLVNVGLAFVGLSFLEGNPLAQSLTIFAAVPLVFFAVYRARRYIMARTRWRGIRFGMDNGAWGYAIRAIWYWFLTLITGGLLYPYQQFKLAKYTADRTWFGDLKFQQSGSWAGLFAYWVWLYIVLGMVLLAAWGVAADKGNPSTAVIGFVIAFVGYIAFFVMLMRYEIVAFRYIWSNRSLGDAKFQSEILPGKIIGIYLVGTLLVGICTMLVSGAIIGAILAFGQFVQGVDMQSQLEQLQMSMSGIATAENPGAGIAAFVMAAAFFYILFFAVPFAFTHIFITRPIMQRKAETMVIHDAQTLTQSRQREHDHAAEAGGFADALGVDVGAGI